MAKKTMKRSLAKELELKCSCIASDKDCGMSVQFSKDEFGLWLFLKVNKTIGYKDLRYHRVYDIKVDEQELLNWIEEIKKELGK